MCAITVCGALTSFIEPLSATSLARLLWPIISSLTSTVKLLRNLVRQALDFDRAGDDFEQSALHLDAGRLALGDAPGR